MLFRSQECLLRGLESDGQCGSYHNYMKGLCSDNLKLIQALHKAIASIKLDSAEEYDEEDDGFELYYYIHTNHQLVTDF